MRLDGFAPSYPSSDRAAPRGVVVPYRDSQRAVEQARESRETAAKRSKPDFEQLLRRQPSESTGEAGSRPIELMPARFEAMFERPLSTRASQALASYSMTAAISVDFDAPEVVGLDLYA
jgi:hypothetical protein